MQGPGNDWLNGGTDYRFSRSLNGWETPTVLLLALLNVLFCLFASEPKGRRIADGLYYAILVAPFGMQLTFGYYVARYLIAVVSIAFVYPPFSPRLGINVVTALLLVLFMVFEGCAVLVGALLSELAIRTSKPTIVAVIGTALTIGLPVLALTALLW